MVRITTWNVNGIRNPFGYQPWSITRTFDAMFDLLEADIVIMQELKIQRKDLRDDMVLVPGWDCYFSLPKHKKGYSGVGIYTRQSVCAPIRAEEGLTGVLHPPGSSTPYRDLPEDECIGGYPTATQLADLADDPRALDSEGRVVDPATLDAEGRCVVLEFPAFVIFGVYSPANSNGMRGNFRYSFLCTLDTRIRNLQKMGKNVILTGDLNVSREEIDTARAEEAMREEGITRAQYLSAPNRRIFNQLLENGQVVGPRDEGREKPVLWDICREFHPKREGMYTHWEQKINARPGNFGSRIDYVLCSSVISSWFQDSNIQEGLMGSDHCPVYATTKDIVEWRGEEVHIVDILNPPGMFKDGKRMRDYDAAKDPRPTSGKLMTEFNNRRSIKDMFAKKPTPAIAKSSSSVSTTPLEKSKELESMSYSAKAFSQPSEEQPIETKPVNPINPLKSPEKRRVSVTSPAKPVKRTKSNISNGNSQPFNKGQKTIKGFFAAKPTVSHAESISTTVPLPPTTLPEDSQTSMSPDQSQTTQSQTSIDAFSEPFIDPEASKESWAKLFSGKPPPRCEHGEPCKSFKVKKAGPNCGREFWLCARPLGPTGQKEKGTQWRCPTYIWASDWKGSD